MEKRSSLLNRPDKIPKEQIFLLKNGNVPEKMTGEGYPRKYVSLMREQ